MAFKWRIKRNGTFWSSQKNWNPYQHLQIHLPICIDISHQQDLSWWQYIYSLGFAYGCLLERFFSFFLFVRKKCHLKQRFFPNHQNRTLSRSTLCNFLTILWTTLCKEIFWKSERFIRWYFFGSKCIRKKNVFPYPSEKIWKLYTARRSIENNKVTLITHLKLSGSHNDRLLIKIFSVGICTFEKITLLEFKLFVMSLFYHLRLRQYDSE